MRLTLRDIIFLVMLSTSILFGRINSFHVPRVLHARYFSQSRRLKMVGYGGNFKPRDFYNHDYPTSYRGSQGSTYPQNSANQINFKETIKINTEQTYAVDEMPFSKETVTALKNKGFERMTPVQSQSFSHIFNGNDVVARSRTGTGKTLAFGIPLIEQLAARGLTKRNNVAQGPLVLILEPTRELVIQVAEELSNICSPHGMTVTTVYGGSSIAAQQHNLRGGVHIVVATTGRMLDHIERGSINLNSVCNVVLDEGDTMLEMGFQEDVEKILSCIRQKSSFVDPSNSANNREAAVQLLLFSATMPAWICGIANRLMNNPVFLDAIQEGETRLASTIAHYCMMIPNSRDRITAVKSYLEDIILTKGQGGQTIIFTNTKEEADRLNNLNCFGNLNSQVLHGDISQASRQRTLTMFREKAIDVLVATDVAARGLDIAGVELVIHISPPRDEDTYVHRSGRTGRAGRNGTAIIFHTSTENFSLQQLQSKLKFRFERMDPPKLEEVMASSVEVIKKKLGQVQQTSVDCFSSPVKQIVEDLYKSANMTSKEAAYELMLAKCFAALSTRNSGSGPKPEVSSPFASTGYSSSRPSNNYQSSSRYQYRGRY